MTKKPLAPAFKGVSKYLPAPPFRGVTDGQCRTVEWRVKTGKRFPWTPPGRAEPIWLPVIEGRCIICWIWDAREREWVDADIWRMRRAGQNAGKICVSKHDDLHRQFADRQRRARLIEKAKRDRR